ncbi:MAG: hypothetical protein M8841_01620 [marine benthic group bacterium]|nr:hypothetical protein [Gemmatimonadota bacterium]
MDRARTRSPANLGLLLLAVFATAGTQACQPDANERGPVLPTARFELTGGDIPASAIPVLDEALSRWSRLISTPVPIRARVTFVDGGPAGYAIPNVIRNFDRAPIMDTWFPSALADAISGRDLQPEELDVELFFRRDRDWKFEIAGDPAPGQADFLTVAMHEIAHGLGMASWVFAEESVGYYGREIPSIDFFPSSIELPDLAGVPMVFVRMIEDMEGHRLTDTSRFANPSRELRNLLKRDQIFFAGSAAREANGGRPPRLYGASPSHLHPDDYFWTGPDFLMTPTSGTGISTPDPGPIVLGILQDIGWRVSRNP